MPKRFQTVFCIQFSLIRIPYSKWLALIKLFELSVSAKTASEQMHLSYKTTLKAFDIIRYSILEELAKTDHDSLVFNGYKHLLIDHSKMFGSGDVYINGIEDFWSYAKESMAKHHGVSPGKFLLYIKEMEWRYNNRDCNLFDLLLKYMLGAIGT